MSIRVFPDRETLSRAAAEIFVGSAGEAITRQGRFAVALAGGSTPRRCYELLAASPSREQVSWGAVDFFWGDERCVPPDHSDSNYRMAREALLAKLTIDQNKIHRMPAEREDLERAASEYQTEIARAFAADPQGPPPRLDLVLLGLGPDCHTASLFPHSAALQEKTHWVVRNYVERFGAYRLTLTVPILNRARQVVFLVAGADKAEALAAVLEGPRDPLRLPAQLIRPEAGELAWLVDKAAARALTLTLSRKGII
jgi:6-phosphogluconolactonase